MKRRDAISAERLDMALAGHARDRRSLPGIEDARVRGVFVRQMIDSLHRVRYPVAIAARAVSQRRADPTDAAYFDPLRAALFHFRKGCVDEACWLVFLFVHFGKHARGGYRYARDVYGRLGQGGRWDWPSVSTNTIAFETWLGRNHDLIRRSGPGGFGSHRKYESLRPDHTGRAVATYVAWVNPLRGHKALLSETLAAAGGDQVAAFDRLYDSMATVVRFGRTARFDYLTMLGKLGIVSIVPGSLKLKGATGPLVGVRRLYGVGQDVSNATLEAWLRELDAVLGVGPQALEDALCNWQKSPGRYRAFRG